MIKNIVIHLGEGKKLILYPEGGLEIGQWVQGPGWILDTKSTDTYEAILQEAANICTNAAQHEKDFAEQP